MDLREDDLRARRADVDADRRQGDVVLNPERVFFQRTVAFPLVVLVVGVFFMFVLEGLAVNVVGHQVALCSLVFFFVCHRRPSLDRLALPEGPRRARPFA